MRIKCGYYYISVLGSGITHTIGDNTVDKIKCTSFYHRLYKYSANNGLSTISNIGDYYD
jgi:hypothetical protein